MTTADSAQTRQQRYERGAAVLDAVDGAAGARVVAALADVSPDLAHHVVAWGFGDIYARPGLRPRDRQLVTLGMLTALGGCEPQLEVHVGAALNVGLTAPEIVEALLHSAVYCGFPRALNATFTARKVFAERGLLPVRTADTAGCAARAAEDAGPMTERPERWTRATVYPDMWVNPQNDPRNTDGVSPDGELPTLQDYLRDYRLTLTMKCEGLDAEQLARRSVPPSSLSLLGLVRHLAEVERDWRTWVRPDRPLDKLYGPAGGDFAGAVGDPAVVDGAFADLAREQRETDELLARYPDLGERVGDQGIALREIWVHRIDEYARHCGHADLLRECIDGRVGQ